MATTRPDLDIVQELVTEFGENASYVADLLARYRMNPASVDEESRAFFRERLGEEEAAPPARPEGGRREAGGGETLLAAARAAPAPAAPRAPRAGETPEPLRGAALRVAENMEESLHVPTAT